MIFVVSGGKNFAFVNVVHTHRLKNAGFNKVADACLGHDGNSRHFHDFFDDRGVGHAGHATGGTNVRRYAFQRHDRASACFFSNLGLLGSGDVHNHAAFQHFGKACLQADGALFHISTPSEPGPPARCWQSTAHAAALLGCYICHMRTSDNTSQPQLHPACTLARLWICWSCPKDVQ